MLHAELFGQLNDTADVFGCFGDYIEHLSNVGDAYLQCQV